MRLTARTQGRTVGRALTRGAARSLTSVQVSFKTSQRVSRRSCSLVTSFQSMCRGCCHELDDPVLAGLLAWCRGTSFSDCNPHNYDAATAARGIAPDARLLTHVHTLPQNPSLLSQDETRDKKDTGDQPKNWRATNPRTGGQRPKNRRPPLLFNLEGLLASCGNYTWVLSEVSSLSSTSPWPRSVHIGAPRGVRGRPTGFPVCPERVVY